MGGRKLRTIEEVARIIYSEGLDYAIQEYLSPEDIEDPALRDLWEEAKEKLDSIMGLIPTEDEIEEMSDDTDEEDEDEDDEDDDEAI